jgi:hypothetical protein
MRKRLIASAHQSTATLHPGWLELESAAVVEVTSEDKAYPIESALLVGKGHGWRASKPGKQTLRLIFDEPKVLRRIQVIFEETEVHRTQEFVLRWSPDQGHSFREIIRQQWNFSPPTTTRETEDYNLELSNVTVLELTIVPDSSGGEARASLLSLRLA